MFTARSSFASLAVLIACLGLAACGKPGGEAKSASQVAVKVNADEITVHQVNQALARAGRIAPEQLETVSRQALEQLVDQQLLIQKALEAKLDRNPEIMSALDAARRQILAQAYMERTVAAGVVRPGPDELRAAYDAKPELFAERRIYRLRKNVAAVDGEPARELIALAGKTRNLNEIVTFLRSKDIKFNANSAVRPAEQLPLEALPALARMKDGDIAAQGGNGRVTIVQRVAAQLVPYSIEEAAPLIEQLMQNQKRGELAGAHLKQLRESAKMAYVGEFAQPATAAQPPTPTVARAAGPAPAAASTAAAPAPGNPAHARSFGSCRAEREPRKN